MTWYPPASCQSFYHKPPKEIVEWEWHSARSPFHRPWQCRSLGCNPITSDAINADNNFTLYFFSFFKLWNCGVLVHIQCVQEYCVLGSAKQTLQKGLNTAQHPFSPWYHTSWISQSCTASGSVWCSVKKQHWNVKEEWGSPEEGMCCRLHKHTNRKE